MRPGSRPGAGKDSNVTRGGEQDFYEMWVVRRGGSEVSFDEIVGTGQQAQEGNDLICRVSPNHGPDQDSLRAIRGRRVGVWSGCIGNKCGMARILGCDRILKGGGWTRRVAIRSWRIWNASLSQHTVGHTQAQGCCC